MVIISYNNYPYRRLGRHNPRDLIQDFREIWHENARYQLEKKEKDINKYDDK